MWTNACARSRDVRGRDPGFTLVELMIVVAIIGVLAALATYGISRYVKHSHTAEATRILGALEKADDASFQLEYDSLGLGTGPFVHVFCPTTSPVPASLTQISGTKYKSAQSDWTPASWQCLRFTINEPQSYQYSQIGYSGASNYNTNATYTITAHGDLDGNGIYSTFTVAGQGAVNGNATRTLFVVVNEDE